MKRVILSLVVILGLTNCKSTQPPVITVEEFVEQDIAQRLKLEGIYKAKTFRSVENFTGIITYQIDTTFDVSNIQLAFEGDFMYTIKDNNITQVPLLGFQFQNNFQFYVTLSNNTLMLNSEVWSIEKFTLTDLVISRTTNYGIVGNQKVTLSLQK